MTDSNPTTERIDPSWDPAVRSRAHAIMSQVAYGMRDVLTRHYDRDSIYIEPSGVDDGGDNTGMIYAANNEVLGKLEKVIATARTDLLELLERVDDYKREQYGSGYQPLPRKL